MPIIDLSPDQIGCLVRALDAYQVHLQEYEEDPGLHLEESDSVRLLSNRLRPLAPLSEPDK